MNLDKTFCSSPNCKGACGRKMTSEEKRIAIQMDKPISYAYFCEEHDEENLELKDE